MKKSFGWTCALIVIFGSQLGCEEVDSEESNEKANTESACLVGGQEQERCTCGETISRDCNADGTWSAWSDTCDILCQTVDRDNEETSECAPRQQDEQRCDCGETLTRTCDVDGTWSPWDNTCQNLCTETTECEQNDTVQRECGACGTQERSCERGAWTNWSSCVEPSRGCDNGNECEPRDTQRQECAEACSESVRVCGPAGTWSEWSACQPDPSCHEAVCDDGQTQNQACGGCGSQTSTCVGGQWSAWSNCDEAACRACDDGQLRTQACGSCGQQQATCNAGEWAAWSACNEPEQGCPQTCDTIATWIETQPDDVILGAAIAGDTLAITINNLDLSYLKVLSLESGTLIGERVYGDWWSNTFSGLITTPVYDETNQHIYAGYTVWQSQFGDDGPEARLDAIDLEGNSVWNSHVWAYSSDAWPAHSSLQPVLLGDEIAINTASNFGAQDGIPEQIRAFTSDAGEISWSVESFFTQPMLGGNASLYLQSFGWMLGLTVGEEDMRLLYNASERRQQLSTSLSLPGALSAQGDVLYAANRAHGFGDVPNQNWLVAVDTNSADPETSLWESDLPSDRIINDGPVLSQDLVVVPLQDGLWALDRTTGAGRWVIDTEHRAMSPVVGDSGEIYFLEWSEQEVWVRGVDVAGQPTFRCQLPAEGPFFDFSGNDFSRTVTPLLHNGRLMIPLGNKVLTVEVDSTQLAETGWPRRYGNNHNTSTVR